MNVGTLSSLALLVTLATLATLLTFGRDGSSGGSRGLGQGRRRLLSLRKPARFPVTASFHRLTPHGTAACCGCHPPRQATPRPVALDHSDTELGHSTALHCTPPPGVSRITARRRQAGSSRGWVGRRPGSVAGGELNAGRAQSTDGTGAASARLQIGTSFAGRKLAFASRATPVPTRGRGPSLAEPQAGQEASRPAPRPAGPPSRPAALRAPLRPPSLPPIQGAPCLPLPRAARESTARRERGVGRGGPGRE